MRFVFSLLLLGIARDRNVDSLSGRTHSGSGIFKSENPAKLARAVVLATTHYNDPVKLAEISTGLGEAMRGEGKLGAAAGKEMTADRGY